MRLIKNILHSQGLYKNDEREGPGVFSYADGIQDVGLWHREKIVKLCDPIDGAFSMMDHTEFDFSSTESPKVLTVTKKNNQRHVIDSILNPPELYNYEPQTKVENSDSIFSDALHIGSIAMDIELFDKAFFKDETSDEDEENNNSTETNDAEIDFQRKVWNQTPSLIEMQKHILKHQPKQTSLSYNVEPLLKGKRDSFSPQGPLEELSKELIESAADGDVRRVVDILDNSSVHVDVADKNGYTPLIAASVSIFKFLII